METGSAGKGQACPRPGRPETRRAPSVSWPPCPPADEAGRAQGVLRRLNQWRGLGVREKRDLEPLRVTGDCFYSSRERQAPCVNFDNF